MSTVVPVSDGSQHPRRTSPVTASSAGSRNFLVFPFNGSRPHTIAAAATAATITTAQVVEGAAPLAADANATRPRFLRLAAPPAAAAAAAAASSGVSASSSSTASTPVTPLVARAATEQQVFVDLLCGAASASASTHPARWPAFDASQRQPLLQRARRRAREQPDDGVTFSASVLLCADRESGNGGDRRRVPAAFCTAINCACDGERDRMRHRDAAAGKKKPKLAVPPAAPQVGFCDTAFVCVPQFVNCDGGDDEYPWSVSAQARTNQAERPLAAAANGAYDEVVAAARDSIASSVSGRARNGRGPAVHAPATVGGDGDVGGERAAPRPAASPAREEDAAGTEEEAEAAAEDTALRPLLAVLATFLAPRVAVVTIVPAWSQDALGDALSSDSDDEPSGERVGVRRSVADDDAASDGDGDGDGVVADGSGVHGVKKVEAAELDGLGGADAARNADEALSGSTGAAAAMVVKHDEAGRGNNGDEAEAEAEAEAVAVAVADGASSPVAEPTVPRAHPLELPPWFTDHRAGRMRHYFSSESGGGGGAAGASADAFSPLVPAAPHGMPQLPSSGAAASSYLVGPSPPSAAAEPRDALHTRIARRAHRSALDAVLCVSEEAAGGAGSTAAARRQATVRLPLDSVRLAMPRLVIDFLLRHTLLLPANASSASQS